MNVNGCRSHPISCSTLVHEESGCTYEDLPLKEISSDLRSRLERFRYPSLIGSVDFSELYSNLPNGRVAIAQNFQEILQSFCYEERKWNGLLKEINIVGPVDLSSPLFHWVLANRQPSLTSMSLQSSTEFPNRIGGQRLLGLRRMAEDCRIDLPRTANDFLLQVGPQARKHLPYYVRRLEREWGERLTIIRAAAQDISPDSFSALLELNRARMYLRKRTSLWTQEIARQRWPLVSKLGLVVGLRLDGSIIGGTVSLIYNNEAYLIVIAHAPLYNRLNIGTVSLWKTVEHLIELGCSTFHLLWGESFYKAQFGARVQPLYEAAYASGAFPGSSWNANKFLRLSEARHLWNSATIRLAYYEQALRRVFHSDRGATDGH